MNPPGFTNEIGVLRLFIFKNRSVDQKFASFFPFLNGTRSPSDGIYGNNLLVNMPLKSTVIGDGFCFVTSPEK